MTIGNVLSVIQPHTDSYLQIFIKKYVLKDATRLKFMILNIQSAFKVPHALILLIYLLRHARKSVMVILWTIVIIHKRYAQPTVFNLYIILMICIIAMINVPKIQ